MSYVCKKCKYTTSLKFNYTRHLTSELHTVKENKLICKYCEKEYKHKFTALTDDALWYCVFAIRDEDGELSDIYPETSSPFFIKGVSDTYWSDRKKLEDMSI